MRRFFIVAALTAALACSCSREGTELFEGNYSFKTSGVVQVHRISEIKDTTSTVPDSLALKLVTESGQMDITPVSNGNEMVISMNVIGGDLVILQSVAEGDELTVRPTNRNVVFRYEGGGLSSLVGSEIESELTVSGTGRRYDDIVLFTFDYAGVFRIGENEYEIYDSRIDCRAKLNE